MKDYIRIYEFRIRAFSRMGDFFLPTVYYDEMECSVRCSALNNLNPEVIHTVVAKPVSIHSSQIMDKALDVLLESQNNDNIIPVKYNRAGKVIMTPELMWLEKEGYIQYYDIGHSFHKYIPTMKGHEKIRELNNG